LRGEHGPNPAGKSDYKGYFPGTLTRGANPNKEAREAAANMARAQQMLPQLREQYGPILDQVLRGSNTNSRATGNESGGPIGRGPTVAKTGPERHLIEGYANHMDWARSMATAPTGQTQIATAPAAPSGRGIGSDFAAGRGEPSTQVATAPAPTAPAAAPSQGQLGVAPSPAPGPGLAAQLGLGDISAPSMLTSENFGNPFSGLNIGPQVSWWPSWYTIRP